MPRPVTEAAQYLDMYKLTVEKTRLEQELEYIDGRRQQLCDRLAEIERETAGLDAKATTLRQPTQSSAASKPQGLNFAPSTNVYLPERNSRQAPQDYNTLTLDY
ncbi:MULTISPECIES: gas vesicle protein [Cyanophyceae]|uniref:gas vesicle protein n=1 Tax=Cyanophyceae TaxID=3028117 RepID=UPI0016893FB2|nr:MULTISPECIES: gas vesicle protein [Cyanophyceae]MBD1915634.1 gas vesicle protein [Phormidium sp. FACHB-77]MBD2031944.1 gas vesicle protein [Phormidium sp. FACHB-322]MBD2050694.1 gas vesicle protein [Leptolyngbya sp. FACHB-60]